MTVLLQTSMEVVQCTCGISYAVPAELHRQAQQFGKSLHCPMGHGWHYTESEVEKWRQKYIAKIGENDRLSARLSEAERKLGRVNRGICPHCNRHFPNMARHIKIKHKNL